VLLSTDLTAMRGFCHARLGLEIQSESEAAITSRRGIGQP